VTAILWHLYFLWAAIRFKIFWIENKYHYCNCFSGYRSSKHHGVNTLQLKFNEAIAHRKVIKLQLTGSI
jgi:hypothetical protein